MLLRLTEQCLEGKDASLLSSDRKADLLLIRLQVLLSPLAVEDVVSERQFRCYTVPKALRVLKLVFLLSLLCYGVTREICILSAGLFGPKTRAK